MTPEESENKGYELLRMLSGARPGFIYPHENIVIRIDETYWRDSIDIHIWTDNPDQLVFVALGYENISSVIRCNYGDWYDIVVDHIRRKGYEGETDAFAPALPINSKNTV